MTRNSSPAPARGEIGGPDALGYDLRGLGQDVIAAVVAVLVVKELEIVYVAHDDGDPLGAAAGPRRLAPEGELGRATIGEAG